MADPVAHILHRKIQKARGGDTAVVGGVVTEISGDASLVKVQMSPEIEPVWVRADGVTAIGAQVDVALGTDGRPLTTTTTAFIPTGRELAYVGATGKKIRGQQIEIDQAMQELAAARARLDQMDGAIEMGAKRFVASESAPTPADADGLPVPTLWSQVESLDASPTEVLGRWVLTGDGWLSMQDGAGTIAAESVAAAVGVFIDAMMENITVTGAANISEAAIGTLTARIAEIIRLNVEQVIVGRDIRFTSSGLVFYAPPADGQDPDDWPNRTPLIAMTPTGDTSIAVAQDGRVTAGITPEGDVWGRVGRFDGLEVGGYDVGNLIALGPRGALALTRVNRNVPINNVLNHVMSVSTTLHTGRLYRMAYSLGMARSAGEVRVRLTAQVGGTETIIGEKGQSVDGEFSSSFQFTADEYGIADGATVELKTGLRTVNSGATGTLWGFGAQLGGMPSMLLEDLGPTPPVYVVEGAAPAAPPATWYGPEGIVSGEGAGVRANGTAAPDGRLTVGGSIWGADMAEWVVYPINLSRLNGATVRSATVVLTVTQNAPIPIRLDVGTGATGTHVNIFNGTAGSNGQFVCEIPASLHQHLVGKSALIVKPFYPGSTSSYGTMGATASLNVIYSR